MNMLRHRHITGDDKSIAQPRGLRCVFEDTIGRRVAQKRLPSIATEGEKVEAASLLVPDESFGHCGDSTPPPALL
jgi:hypothetical protein